MFTPEQKAALRHRPELLGVLSPRTQEIVRLRWGLVPGEPALSLADVARRFKYTRERIRQIEHRAIEEIEAETLVKRAIAAAVAEDRRKIAAWLREDRGNLYEIASARAIADMIEVVPMPL